jgi:hypothetical protein
MGKLLSAKFGQGLIPMWPFSETNAAAMHRTRAAGGRRTRMPLKFLCCFNYLDNALD